MHCAFTIDPPIDFPGDQALTPADEYANSVNISEKFSASDPYPTHWLDCIQRCWIIHFGGSKNSELLPVSAISEPGAGPNSALFRATRR